MPADPEETARRAARAQALLDDAMMVEAIDATKASRFAAWLSSKDPADRERLHAEAMQTADLLSYLRNVVAEAKLAIVKAKRPT